MPTVTLTVAARLMRQLISATTARLRGIDLDRDARQNPTAAIPAPNWPAEYNQALAARVNGQATGSSPFYVVFSDDFPVCWLNHDGHLVHPDVVLDRLRTRHRALASEALTDLARPALAYVADLRDVRDGRPQDVEDRTHRPGLARVAHPDLPARAWWISVGHDITGARERSRAVAGTEDPLIISAHGFGRYGRQTHRLDLGRLCAINATATKHGAGLSTLARGHDGERSPEIDANVVGSWLAEEYKLDAAPDAELIEPLFTAALIGSFSSDYAYADYRLKQTGWETTLRQMNAQEFFDMRHYVYCLFRRDVRAISAPGGIVVLRRHH
ncbi:hypothetical protein [Cryptosporangium phraense]|uniref:Uncharacterized protein n=1 Tax=Cryptosporangium phraense TaxID=2593070 RepID=A0A545AN28_9ACTN|nr:hypothetical protein [Cryptosporangium phraense]TQS42744.1 hypothetical protein FL583_22020 [Cryptosporangium phraense]